MAKDPAVLFYTQDFLVGASMLTPLQKGHYITLLCYQQQLGSLPLEQIKVLMGKDFKKNWPVLNKKFSADENGFFNERMRREVDRRKKFSDSQRERVRKRYGDTPVEPGKSPGSTTVLPIKKHATETETETSDQGGAGGMTWDVEKMILDNPIQFERIVMNTVQNVATAKAELRKYHLYLIDKEEYPKSKRRLLAGFEKWLMNDKIIKNGSNKQTTGNSPKPSASELRNKKVREY